jgi:hypothetical protein
MASRPEVARLRALSTMPEKELRSRRNALPDLLSAVAAVMPLLDMLPIEQEESRESSAEMAHLAGFILNMGLAKTKKVDQFDYNGLLTKAKQLAGSVLSQRADAVPSEQAPLPLDDVAGRALDDAQKHGQAR